MKCDVTKFNTWIPAVILLAIVLAAPGFTRAQDDAAETDNSATASDDESNGDAEAATTAEAEATAADDPTDEPPANTGSDPASQTGPKAEAWEEKLTAWKTLLSEMRDLREQYTLAENEDLDQIRKDYNDKLAQGRKLLPELKLAAREAFVEAPNEDRQIARFLLKAVADEIRAERYQQAYDDAQFLIAHGFGDKRLYDIAGTAAFATNRLPRAKEYLEQAAAAEALTEEGREALATIEQFDLIKLWEEEEKIRAAEAKADDLPRVKFKTNKGDVVIELFENEAPDTVGNFVSLVEKGFYDGRLFHRVIPGFMAQTGDPNGDGSGGPGYRIYCEVDVPDARNHFGGTLSMAHAGKDTGGSQFFLTFKPTPFLNGRHTVFGRVVEGWDTLAKIQRYDPSGKDPKPPLDKIVEAEVLRKRDHEYKPNKVK